MRHITKWTGYCLLVYFLVHGPQHPMIYLYLFVPQFNNTFFFCTLLDVANRKECWVSSLNSSSLTCLLLCTWIVDVWFYLRELKGKMTRCTISLCIIILLYVLCFSCCFQSNSDVWTLSVTTFYCSTVYCSFGINYLRWILDSKYLVYGLR